MAKLIRFIFQRLLLFSLVLSVNTSCSDEPASDADTRLRLTVVTSISGLGDMGYNDNMMSGIMRFYEHHDVNMSLIRPNSLDEVQQAIQIGRKVLKRAPEACCCLPIMHTSQSWRIPVWPLLRSSRFCLSKVKYPFA